MTSSPDPQSPELLESPEAVLSTMTKDGRRKWMYPPPTKGSFYNKRLFTAWGLIALFAALPLIPINGKPSILLDFVHREFTFFGTTLYPTDSVLLMISGIGLLIGIVFITALFGRVWCGWACPQTVYMEFVFRPIERLVEGKPSKQRRRDEKEMTTEKFVRKLIKFSVFGVVSVVMSHVFLSYFVGWSALIAWVVSPPDAHWGFFVAMLSVSVAIFADFAYFREQMCTIMCPYARIQSVLMDRDSQIVSYDPGRGESRGKRTRKQRADEKAGIKLDLGDCVDCGACVRTCPTGIDIRDGLQMECITCTQCIDACDDVMLKVGKPVGLIRYTSENTLEGKKSRVLRPRLLLYVIPMLITAVAFTAVAWQKSGGVEVDVGRIKGAPFTVLPNGQIANRLRFRLRNRTGEATSARLEVVEPKGVRLNVVGEQSVKLPPGEPARVDTFVLVPRDAFKRGSAPARILIKTENGVEETHEFMFLGPSGEVTK